MGRARHDVRDGIGVVFVARAVRREERVQSPHPFAVRGHGLEAQRDTVVGEGEGEEVDENETAEEFAEEEDEETELLDEED
jgi:hypothetical protein